MPACRSTSDFNELYVLMVEMDQVAMNGLSTLASLVVLRTWLTENQPVPPFNQTPPQHQGVLAEPDQTGNQMCCESEVV